MAKVHQLSPENYIRTKARTLPIVKCLITPGWQEMGMANVIIMRRHVNGNYTAGLYQVDLMCIGIKDTFYLFNETEEDVEERFNIGEAFFTETDYVTAHNIVYAGHDFAAEFDIAPHKDFAITRYILDEDDDRIPIIDVPVGDEDGKPHLIVSSSYNYGSALQKLKKNAGEGNYHITIGEDDTDDEDEDLSDDFEENDLLTDDFNTLQLEDTEAMMEVLEDKEKPMNDETIIRSELLWRKLKEEKPLSVLTDEKLEQTPEMQLFTENGKAWEEENEATQDIQEEVFEEIQEIQLSSLDDSRKLDKFLKLISKYPTAEVPQLMIFHSIPPMQMLSEFSIIKKELKYFSPAIVLALAAWNNIVADKDPELSAISKMATVGEAFPGKKLHGLHIKSFWLLKALDAITENDTKDILYYHALLRTTGVGGGIRYIYAVMLNVWLCKFLAVPEEDILYQDEG